MRSAAAILAFAAAVFPPAALGQPDRKPYRDAYDDWRVTDPNLERDAATSASTLGARADKMAMGVAAFHVAKKAYLEALVTDLEQKAAAIGPEETPAEYDREAASYVASQNSVVAASIATIAGDPDRLIQQLRTALERERTTLAALTSGFEEARKGRDALESAGAAVEQSRAKLADHYRALAAGVKQTAGLTGQAGSQWANYYRALSDGARGIVAPEPPPLTTSAPAPTVVAPAPAPAPRPRTITPLPLSRYVGAWVYPTIGAQYHGAQPEFVDMVLREENGRASGTLFARFRLPQGSPGDPTVRFDFEGEFQNSRNQSFVLTTSNGASGSVELIPGPAFNLLEVSFTTDDKPGTVRQGNFLLVKK